MIKRIWVKCDYCGIEEAYEDDLDPALADWMRMEVGDEEWVFCSKDCLIAYL